MSEEKYNPETDIFANWNFKRDFQSLYISNQNLQPNPYVRHHLHPKSISEENRIQLIKGLGLKNPLFWIITGFGLYTGGLFQARRQFINGGDYFLNAKFDFIGGRRPILVGLVVGVYLGSRIAGNRYLLNDYIQSKINSCFKFPREIGSLEEDKTLPRNFKLKIFDR